MGTSYSGRLGTAPEEAVKAPCVVASLSDITLSATQTISGVAVVAGDRVLVAGQTDSTENGIYDAASGAWTRSTDWNDAEDVVRGQLVFVPNALYEAVFTGSYSPGTTALSFSSVTALPNNKTTYEFTSDIGLNSHAAIVTGHTIQSTHFDSSRVVNSGAVFYHTGTTTLAKANTVPNSDGHFYDADGKQFIAGGVTVSVRSFGAVGDGSTDDTNAIQYAINYVNSTGNYGTVVIPPSANEYIFTSIQNKTKVTLKGSGGILKYKDNTAISAGVSYYLIYNLSGEKVTYEDLIIEGNKANNTTFTVADAITGTGAFCIIRNCRIFNPPDSGIMFSDANRGMCVGNYVEGAPDAGIYVNGTLVLDASTADSQGGLVQGNIIKSCGYNGITIKRGVQDVTVDGNTVFDCGNGIGTESFGSGNNPWNVTISNNQILNIGFGYRSLSPPPAERGIDLQLSDRCTVTGNRLHEIGGAGISVSGGSYNTVTGNVMSGYTVSPATAGQLGIHLETRESTDPTHNTISKNTIESFQDFGLSINNGNLNIIEGNITTGSTTAISLLAGSDNNMIVSNLFDGGTNDMLVNSGSTGNIFRDNRLVNSVGVFGMGETVTATNVITGNENGTTYYLNSATEFVSTLPAPALGLKFKFVVAAAPSGANYTVVTNGSANIIHAQIASSEDAAGSVATVASADTISFVSAKAIVGDYVEVNSDGTSWFVSGMCKVQDGITTTQVS